MKFNLIPKTTTFILIVVSALVIQNPAWAFGSKNNLAETRVIADLISDSPSSTLTIAQSLNANSPLDGTWRLTFIGNGVVHSALLTMQGSYGVAKVTYFDSNLKRIQNVDQLMQLRSSSKGIALFGYNPVYSGTSIAAPYSPDNFFFTVSNDSLRVVNCDDKEVCSWVRSKNLN